MIIFGFNIRRLDNMPPVLGYALSTLILLAIVGGMAIILWYLIIDNILWFGIGFISAWFMIYLYRLVNYLIIVKEEQEYRNRDK